MIIREITQYDNKELASIIRYNFEKHHLDIPGTVYFDKELDHLSDYYLNNTKRRYFVVYEKDELIGGVGLAEFDYFNNCAELQKLYLKESAKGKGLGKRLVQYIIDCAKDMGYERLYIETHSNFNVAINLYKKFGFEEIEKPSIVQHDAMNTFFIKDIK